MFSKANDVDKEGKNFSCWNWISRVLYTIRYAIISCSNQCLINFQVFEKDAYISLASFDHSFVCGILRNGPFPQ